MNKKAGILQRYLKYGYLILICTVLPLYMPTGYYALGEAKGRCYMVLSFVFALIFIVTGFKKLFTKGRIPAALSIAALAFLFSNLVTLIFAVDRKVAFFGLEGWRCGFLSIFLMLFMFYVYYEKEDKPTFPVMMVLMVTPLVECVLAILYRIGIVPFEIYGQNPGFLGTLGNINWFVCFFSVFAPLSIGLSYVNELFSRQFFIWSGLSVVILMALFMQGGDSAFMVLGSVYLTLLFYSLRQRKALKGFCVQLIILGLAMETAGILMTVFEEDYLYVDNLLRDVSRRNIGASVMAAGLLIWAVCSFCEKKGFPYRAAVLYTGAAVLLLLPGAFFLIPAVKNLDYNSGNGRVLIYSICLDMFRQMSPLRMFVGTGQDCLSVYAYNDPVTAQSLYNVFDFNTLTNAHCDMLNILIERGILGTAAYLFLMLSFAAETVRQKNKRAALICALILSSYFMTSLVSFALPLSQSYMLLAMGIGLSVRQDEK